VAGQGSASVEGVVAGDCGVHHDAAGDEESPSESGIGVVLAIVLLTIATAAESE